MARSGLGWLALSAGLVAWPASASPPWTRAGAVWLGDDPTRVVVRALERLDVDASLLEVERRRSFADSRLELVTVRASPCGIALVRPVARALVADGHRLVALQLDPGLRMPGCRRPRLDEANALARVQATGRPGAEGARSARLQWREHGGEPRLGWRVDPPADLSVPTNPVFWVDDASGAVSVLVDRVRQARVRAWPINPLATPDTQLHELNAVDPGAAHLEGPFFAAANCIAPANGEGWCHRERTATPDMAGDFVYPEPDLDGAPDPEDLFAEAAGYYHLDRMFAWLQQLGFSQAECHAQGEVIEIVVNRRKYEAGAWEGEDNAFYSGSCGASTLMMGQGAHDFAYDGDIVYHELTHAVIERLAGPDFGVERRRSDALGFDASAIDEGVADFFAAAFTDDPLVAEYAFPSGGRGLDHDFRCPRDLTGEAHADGQIIGGALWEAREQVGEAFVPVVLDMLAMIDDDASFEDAAAALETMTDAALGDEASAQLHAILDARGLVDCPRVVPFDEFGVGGVHEDLGLSRLLHLRSPRLGNIYAPAAPPPVQWAIEMPDDADTATLTFSISEEYAITQPIALGIRRELPIAYDYVVEGKDIQVSADTDEVVLGADDGEVVFSAEPGTTVYAALFHLGTPDPATDRWLFLHDFELAFTCAAGSGQCAPASDTDTGTQTDAGHDQPGDAGGCACAARTGDRAPGLALLVLAALGRRRASRRGASR